MEELGVEMKLGQAYESLAAAAAYRNLATMKSGFASNTADQKPAVAPDADRIAAIKAAAALGFVPVIMLDVHKETDWFAKFAQRKGTEAISYVEMEGLMVEYASHNLEGNAMYSDFFADWMADREGKQITP